MALLISATTAFSSHQAAGEVSIGIDANPEGNEATSIGPVDACRSVDPGQTFEIDVFVRDVPVFDESATTGSLGGFGFNMLFDPSVVRVMTIDNEQMISDGTPFEIFDADASTDEREPLPSESGNLQLDYATLGGDVRPSGDGILSRLTLEAISPGRSDIVLEDALQAGIAAPSIREVTGAPYAVSQVANAVIAVGESCDAVPVPTPFDPRIAQPSDASTSPTDSADSTALPTGDTALAIDAVPSGNEATALGEINVCAAATVGDRFVLDVVIQNVEDLLGWEAAISFDPQILRVVDRDVNIFQAANEGSSVVDASTRTPDESGLYQAAAVDTADPPSPDSGSGVLVRLTLEAVGEGTSTVSLDPVDLNNDNVADRGVLLRATDGEIIGDEDGDTFFDGPLDGAEVRVGDDCPDGSLAVLDEAGPTDAPDGADDDDGLSSSWLWFVAGVAVVVLVAAGGVYIWMARRKKSAG